MQNFTTEHLLQYLYGEMSENQKNEIKNELMINWALNEKLKVFTEGSRRLNRIKLLSPRRQTIASILQYASNTNHVVEKLI